MAKRFTTGLSAKGFRNIARQIHDYRNDLTEKCKEFARQLAEEGVAIAQLKILSFDAVMTGELLDSMELEPGDIVSCGSTYYIYTNCSWASFVEFGTGVEGKENPHPDTGIVGWKYDTNEHGENGWLEFLYSTAVRVSELARLNRNDIHFSSKDLIVFGKGAKERRVYLNERTNMYLKEYLQSRADENEALFVGLKSPYERLTKAGIEDIIRRIGGNAGVSKAHPHRFRRTALTNALNRGMPLQEAMILAGHAKPETTMGYCTVDQEAVQYHHKKYLSA